MCEACSVFAIHYKYMADDKIRCKIILRHTHIIKKGEIYQKPKSSVVWVGET